MNLTYEIFLSMSKGSLTCRKILLQGADGFTSPPKKASTLTTRPPRTAHQIVGNDAANLSLVHAARPVYDNKTKLISGVQTFTLIYIFILSILFILF
jgi:hypothetical protein